MGGPTFLPFLPADNTDLADPASRAALEKINEDLGQLLKMAPGDFWGVLMQEDRSLHDCLDSFLRFKRRGYDERADGVEGVSQTLSQITRRVFLVYLRMVSQESGPGVPPPQQQARAIYDAWLLDVPKLMDLSAIYGPSNGPLVARLVAQLLRLQPAYWGDVAAAAGPLAGNLRELRAGCGPLAARALAGGDAGAIKELGDRVRYFLDATLTLAAFLDALPPAAPLLLLPGPGELLIALAGLHDETLSALQRVTSQPGAAAKGAPAPEALALLGRATAAAAARMVSGAYCARDARRALEAAAANGAAAEAAAAAAAAADPEAQGQALMSLLMAVAHAGDAHGDDDRSPGDAGVTGGVTLLQRANTAHRLDVAVAAAVRDGIIALDDAQLDYLLVMLGSDRSKLPPAGAVAAGSSAGAGPSGSGGAGPSSSGSGGDAGPSGSGSGRGGPGPVEMASLVSSVKEVLPDYGEGFITACLYHCSWDAERVLHGLLEGSPPPAVAALGLPTSLLSWQPPGGGGGKGKGSAAAAAAAGLSEGPLSWTALAAEARSADAAAVAAGSAIAAVPVPTGPNRQKAAPDRRTARVLGAKTDQMRSLTLSLAEEYQYEDEYDDSFDDLVNLKNDGVCDAEGEETEAEAAARRVRQLQQFGAGGSGNGGAAAGPSGSSSAPGGGRGGGPGRGGAAAGGRGSGRQKKERLWVLDGRIYNYPKPGAQEVAGQEGAQKALHAAAEAAQQIYGLGPGGNVPLDAQQQQRQQQQQQPAGQQGGRGEGGAEAGPGFRGQQQQQQQQQGGGGGGRDGAGGGRGGRGGRGGGGRGGGGGGGRGEDGEGGSGGGGDARRRAFKESHKSAIANHHRKDRAFKKQGLL